MAVMHRAEYPTAQDVVKFIRDTPGATIMEIAGLRGFNSQSSYDWARSRVKTLIRRGLVTSVPHPDDTRMRRYFATAED